MATATLLLPARSRLAAGAWPQDVARAFGRADHRHVAAGEGPQLRRHFALVADDEGAWPVAALTRQLDAGDAGAATWLRADPACVVPDMHGARMMGHGDTLQPGSADVDALLPALQPLFAEQGMHLEAPVPSRWYLRIPPGLGLPDFAGADAVLGDDLFLHLPTGSAGRCWRALLTETQVVLHAHPWNARRVADGRRPINSLWFWGAGRLPERVTTQHAQVRSPDALLRALAVAAGVPLDGEPAADALVDLRRLRATQALAEEALRPLLDALRRGELRALQLDFEDGLQVRITAAQRWRLWRKPLSLDAA